ncbi:MAG: sodium/proline symporter [Gammaproteobacteria bacterium]|nr:sodium/proline symporter [Gammaproteobacteria bacterium]
MNATTLSFWVYTLFIMGVGIYSARFCRSGSTDFYLANRGIGAWVAALSSSASAESGWVTLGLVGMAFQTGIGALWIIPGTVLAFLFNWLVLAERLRKVSRNQGSITLPDVLAGKFSGRQADLIRLLAVLIILVMLGTYVAAQFNAAGKMFFALLGWPYHAGVIAGTLIVLIYTVSGGFRAVAWTDVIQALFMIGAVIILPVVLLVELGGIDAMWQHLTALDANGTLTHPLAGKAGMALTGFLAGWLGIPLGYCGQPHILIRFMATRDENAIRRGTLISTLWVFLLFSGAVLLGIFARAYYGVLDDPETVLPRVATELLPGAIGGMMIAAVLAAICSTADSQLLVSASAVSHDLYVRLLGRHLDDRKVQLFNRMVVLAIGLIAMGFALGEVRVIFDFVLYAWAGLGAAFGPVLILVLLWKRTSAAGVIAGMTVGFVTAIIWRQMLHDQLYELLPAFLLAFIVTAWVSRLWPDEIAPGNSKVR